MSTSPWKGSDGTSQTQAAGDYELRYPVWRLALGFGQYSTGYADQRFTRTLTPLPVVAASVNLCVVPFCGASQAQATVDYEIGLF